MDVADQPVVNVLDGLFKDTLLRLTPDRVCHLFFTHQLGRFGDIPAPRLDRIRGRRRPENG
jgi:hypothetical protein